MARLVPCPSSESCSCFLPALHCTAPGSCSCYCLSVQTRLTLALLKDRPCRSSPVPPRSSPTSFTVENSSGLSFSPCWPNLLSLSSSLPPLGLLPLLLHASAALLVGQDDDTSTLHCGLDRVSRRRSVESRRTTTGNSQRPQEGTYPTPSCIVWYRLVLSVDRAWPVRLGTVPRKFASDRPSMFTTRHPASFSFVSQRR